MFEHIEFTEINQFVLELTAIGGSDVEGKWS